VTTRVSVFAGTSVSLDATVGSVVSGVLRRAVDRRFVVVVVAVPSSLGAVAFRLEAVLGLMVLLVFVLADISVLSPVAWPCSRGRSASNVTAEAVTVLMGRELASDTVNPSVGAGPVGLRSRVRDGAG